MMEIAKEKENVFKVVTLCNSAEVHRSYGRTYRLHLQGRKERETRNQQEKDVYLQQRREDINPSFLQADCSDCNLLVPCSTLKTKVTC
jgi:hypothetical protein